MLPQALVTPSGPSASALDGLHGGSLQGPPGPVLQATYNRLEECENDWGYAALLMRDDVGDEMCRFNFRERKFMKEFVWPRVVMEVRADNRIRKARS